MPFDPTLNLQAYISRHTNIDIATIFNKLRDIENILRHQHHKAIPRNLTWQIRPAQDGSWGQYLTSNTFACEGYSDAQLCVLARPDPLAFNWWFYPSIAKRAESTPLMIISD